MQKKGRLKVLCEQYEDLALRYLYLPGQHESADIAALRVAFYFPNLSPEHRALLEDLWMAAYGCRLSIGFLSPKWARMLKRDTGFKKELEEFAKRTEPDFVRAKQAVEKSGLISCLTPFQKNYLKNELMNVGL